jgi:DNA-binding transcriptional LysR family regulator
MDRKVLDDLLVFATVAEQKSFTKAAARLGLAQSSLSRTVRELEERWGVRLLARTTRSVAPTAAGERLLRVLAPRFQEIDAEIASIRALRDKPAGTIRLTATEYAADTILLPKLAPLLRDHPDIHVEIAIDYGLTDIVAERFDAGVRSGEQVEKDMIAVPIGPEMRMAVVGSPGYLREHGVPMRPKDLLGHRCINLRLPTRGGVYAWEFERGKRELRVRVEGQLVLNTTGQMLRAAIEGMGLAYVPRGLAEPYIAAGSLRSALDDWCQPYSGYHLYYPSRRQASAAFALVVETLRYRKRGGAPG